MSSKESTKLNKLAVLGQNSREEIALHQTYRPSITSCFIIQLFLLSLHVLKKRVFAQILVISRPLNVNILRHLGTPQIPAHAMTKTAADRTLFGC